MAQPDAIRPPEATCIPDEGLTARRSCSAVVPAYRAAVAYGLRCGGRPRFRRKVVPSYSVRNAPRRCNPGTTEPLMEHPMVCIMPAGHVLAAKSLVRPAGLDGLPFVSFDPEGTTGQRVATVLAGHGLRPHVVLVANVFVAVAHETARRVLRKQGRA